MEKILHYSNLFLVFNDDAELFQLQSLLLSPWHNFVVVFYCFFANLKYIFTCFVTQHKTFISVHHSVQFNLLAITIPITAMSSENSWLEIFFYYMITSSFLKFRTRSIFIFFYITKFASLSFNLYFFAKYVTSF